MITRQALNLEQLLNAVAEEIDISPSAYDAAVERYDAVTNWLQADDSALLPFSPDIYPQGSFRLGTIIKPISDEDDYDLDLVCSLRDAGKSIGQERLKRMVGDRLKQNVRYREMLAPERRRCWRLDYAESARFHMDILPAIPDSEFLFLERKVASTITRHAIFITDTECDADDWRRGNPRGYSAWFQERMKIQFDERRRMLAEAKGAAHVEDVPPQEVRTPLQRAVQLLKRHRDIMFADDRDDQPISIIITTLAAKAYDNEPKLLPALASIISGMRKHIEIRNGVHWVENPVNTHENFADRWQTEPKLAENFFAWLDQVASDFNSLRSVVEVASISEGLQAWAGSRAVSRASASLGVPLQESRNLPAVARSRQHAATLSGLALHRQPLRWRELPSEVVTIAASVHRYKDRAFIQRLTPDRKDPLPKGYRLRFVASTTASQPYELYWQVVNTGEEARAARGLRGEILKDERARWESTDFKGSHWIECFVVKNGVCVARSGEFMVNIA